MLLGNGYSLQKSEKDPILKDDEYCEPVWRQYLAAFLASMISMCTGCAGGWTSPALPLLMNGLATDLGGIEAVTAEQASWITSILNLGSLIGSIPAGQLSFYLGRKKFLLYMAVLLIVGWLFIIFNCNYVVFLYVGRFISGVVAGNACVALSMYCNEICCDVIRGRTGVFTDMMTVLGALFVYSVSAVTTLFWSTVLCVTVPIFFLCTFIWMPETPLYLVKNDRKLEAIKSIQWLHGENCDIEKQLSRIYLALLEGKEDSTNEHEKSTYYYLVELRNFFKSLSKTTIKAFCIVILLFIIQRTNGAPIVVYYTVDVFQAAHSSIDPNLATVYTGASQFLFSAMCVIFVDRVGRRILLIVSFSVMLISLSIFVIYLQLVSEGNGIETSFGWIPAVTISIFVGIFRLGVGPIPWFMCAELIPTEDQRWALPVIFFTSWGMAFLTSKTYLSAVSAIGQIGVFTVFIGICALGLLHTVICVPETKNKSRVQIQEELGASKGKFAEINGTH